jgi:hypothetical protein
MNTSTLDKAIQYAIFSGTRDKTFDAVYFKTYCTVMPTTIPPDQTLTDEETWTTISDAVYTPTEHAESAIKHVIYYAITIATERLRFEEDLASLRPEASLSN